MISIQVALMRINDGMHLKVRQCGSMHHAGYTSGRYDNRTDKG